MQQYDKSFVLNGDLLKNMAVYAGEKNSNACGVKFDGVCGGPFW